MSRKKCLILFTVLVAAVALFLSSEVMAGSFKIDKLVPDASNAVPVGYPVPATGYEGIWPYWHESDSDAPWTGWVFAWALTIPSGIKTNQVDVAVAIPDCLENPWKILGAPGGSHLYPPPVGAPVGNSTEGFGAGNPREYVFEWTVQLYQNIGKFWFITDPQHGESDTAAFFLEGGKETEFASNYCLVCGQTENFRIGHIRVETPKGTIECDIPATSGTLPTCIDGDGNALTLLTADDFQLFDENGNTITLIEAQGGVLFGPNSAFWYPIPGTKPQLYACYGSDCP